MTPLLAVFVPLAIAYGSTLSWCVDRWNAPTQYFAHCWLVPLVAAVVVYARRRQWRQRPRAIDRRGLWLLVPGLVLHAAGAALMVDSWSAASLVLTVPGALWFALGRERLRGLWPVVWLTLFAIPVPIYVEGRAAFVLKEIAVEGGASLANLLAADVTRFGDHLRFPGLAVDGGRPAALYVADACGGLRSLLAMLTLAYCLAFFTGTASPLRRTLLLVLAAPLAVAANVARIAALCLMARWFGVPFAEGTGHSVANAVEWLSLVLVLLAADLLITRWLGRAVAPSSAIWQSSLPPSSPSPPAAATPSLLRAGVGLWLLAGPLLWLSLYRPLASGSERAEGLPETVAGYALAPRSAAEQARFVVDRPRYRELLGTDDFVWRRYRDERGAVVWLTALFHDSNWKSVHPPRICIEGSDMTIESDDLVAAPWADGGSVGRIVARRRRDGWRYVTLSVYGTATWWSGDYWQFTLHHLPRALLRQSESGFLLRVETPVYAGEAIAAAERRCADFLGRLLPVAQEQLR